MAQKEQTDVLDQVLVGQKVEDKIRAHAAAGEDADVALELIGRVPGVFQGLPGGLDEVAMLRVHDRRFFGREAEELGVEHIDVLQDRRGGDVVRFSNVLQALAFGQQLFFGEELHRFHAVF